MTAWDHLPAHLVSTYSDPDTIYRQRPLPDPLRVVGVVCTPASPETRLVPRPQPPPIVTIRPCGPHASELYVRTGDGAQVVTVPLSYGLLINMLEDATAALRRCEETK